VARRKRATGFTSVLSLATATFVVGCGSTDRVTSNPIDGGGPGTALVDATSRDASSVASDASLSDEGVAVAPPIDASDGGTTPDASPAGDGAVSPVAPAPAVAAGFTHLVFEDDFTTNDTIAPTQNAASGYKWYWSFDITSTTPWTVQTTATAASVSDAGPGTNASPAGGILTVSGPGQPNDALITVPGWSLNNGSATLPAAGDGNWAHAYFEAYIQARIDGNSGTSPSSGWPAFWS
jgi:hypothetical protein